MPIVSVPLRPEPPSLGLVAVELLGGDEPPQAVNSSADAVQTSPTIPFRCDDTTLSFGGCQ
jgi:hypothetical protein